MTFATPAVEMPHTGPARRKGTALHGEAEQGVVTLDGTKVTYSLPAAAGTGHRVDQPKGVNT